MNGILTQSASIEASKNLQDPSKHAADARLYRDPRNFSFRCLAYFVLILSGNSTFAIDASELIAMLPSGSTFNESISTPEQHLGWKIGTRHVRHHEVVSYARLLCDQSDRLTWLPYGQTFGMRPLGVVIFSRADRQAKFETIIEQRTAWAFSKSLESSSGNHAHASPQPPPSVAWLGYSVHGDESGAVNASLLMLYLLAAAEGPWIDSIMEQQMVLIDPSLNPDGIDRFAQWANDHRGMHPAADPQDIEHQQAWPRGRTNHYGFDLNRDWLPATQPESQGRLELFYRWLPNIVLDFHEMGTDQSLFFQPGIEGRDHPMSPAFVRDITQGFARRYASTMDSVGQRYFTREKYDDFYPGKGSTYPDLHGAVGILVEQGSTRGLIHEYASSTRKFEETVLNPLRLSIASLIGLQEFHRPLLEYQRDFYSTHRKALLPSQPTGYALAIPKDRRIATELISLLNRHRIHAFRTKSPWFVDGRKLETNQWWIIPSDQEQGLFLQAIMDRTTAFPFDKFYDVSAWNMADAFGVDWIKLTSTLPNDLSENIETVESMAVKSAIFVDPNAVAVAIPGNFIHSTTLAQRLMAHGIKLRCAILDCQLTTMNDDLVKLTTGSIVMHRADQTKVWNEAIAVCQQEVNELQLDAISIKTSLTETGPDLGSESFAAIESPRVAILVGNNTDVTGAGGLWFALDRLLQIPSSRIEPSQISDDRLSKYTTLFVPDGDRQRLTGIALTAVREWVQAGGHMVLVGGAVTSFESVVSASVVEKDSKSVLSPVDGVILEAQFDSNGFWSRALGKKSLIVFQNDPMWPITQGAILKLSDRPLIAGYLPESDLKRIAGQTVLGQTKIGKGVVTAMTFDPTFRGHYWSTIGLLKHLLLSPKN